MKNSTLTILSKIQEKIGNDSFGNPCFLRGDEILEGTHTAFVKDSIEDFISASKKWKEQSEMEIVSIDGVRVCFSKDEVQAVKGGQRMFIAIIDCDEERVVVEDCDFGKFWEYFDK
jgi:hypothetical protein